MTLPSTLGGFVELRRGVGSSEVGSSVENFRSDSTGCDSIGNAGIERLFLGEFLFRLSRSSIIGITDPQSFSINFNDCMFTRYH